MQVGLLQRIEGTSERWEFNRLKIPRPELAARMKAGRNASLIRRFSLAFIHECTNACMHDFPLANACKKACVNKETNAW